MKRNPEILLVDDDASLLRLLSIRLASENYLVTSADSAEAALKILAGKRFDLIISDLKMEGMDGLTLLGRVQQSYPNLPVIMMTAHGSISDAVTATQQGVFSFITKPINREALFESIRSALRQTIHEDDEWRKDIISNNKQMETLLNQAYQVAQSDVSVMITGASGTGKELIAEAVHLESQPDPTLNFH